MKRLLLGTALILALAGCGQASGSGDSAGSDPSGTSGSPSGSPSSSAGASPGTGIGACPLDSAAVRGASEVIKADLDGDGTPEQVRRTAADAKGCPSYLVVELGGRTVGAALGDAAGAQGGTDPLAGESDAPQSGGKDGGTDRGLVGGNATFRAVTIPDRKGAVLVVREYVARGGFRDHLFAAAGTAFAELRLGQGPVLPMVITDTGRGFLEVACSRGGFTVTRAMPHEPPGVAAAFDLQKRTYAIDGLDVVTSDAISVVENVLPNQLEKEYPGLSQNQSFVRGCGA